MQYISTLDLWRPGIQSAIERGQIRLQRGQWLRCGATGKRCRFVGIIGGGLWVTHWQGTGAATVAKFLLATKSIKGRA